MRTVKNFPIPIKPKLVYNIIEQEDYRCTNCHERNSGTAHWFEMHYGTANILSINTMELDAFETNGYENFEIREVECGSCGMTSQRINTLFEPIPEEEEDEENTE